MNYSDKVYREVLTKIKNEGQYDKNPRPKWEDGAPAYSKYITQESFSYNIDGGIYPIPTIRNTAIVSGFNEILAIYQSQTNTLKGFEHHNVGWWGAWMNDDGNLGTAYAYNLESHPTLKDRVKVKVKRRLVPNNLVKTKIKSDHIKYVNNFSDDEITKLKNVWLNIVNEGIIERWTIFSDFLLDCRYLPHFHIARKDKFKNWILSRDYYYSNAHSIETSVFLKKSEHDEYYTYNRSNKHDEFIRKELSRNQITELLNNLEKDPYGRRHMLSLFNWKNQPYKTLVECAYENIFAVRSDNNGYILDQNLIQRSSDFITASFINATQYVLLGKMICNHLTLKTGVKWRMGKFKYDINNLHCYDRHEKWIDYILNQDPIEYNPSINLLLKHDFFNVTSNDLIVDIPNNIPKLPEKLEIAQ